MNSDLRKKIVDMICKGKEGHIPSSFSIIDILNYLYEKVLTYDSSNPKWSKRDYFILSKGHGAATLYIILRKFGFIDDDIINLYSQVDGILGGHPDVTKVPGVEASTGSLGHGFPISAGLALGLKIQNMKNRVFCLLGDGECNEGTIWETAMVAKNLQLGNLVAIVDFNGSAAQILPVDPFRKKWEAFGWETYEIDGHNLQEIDSVFSNLKYDIKGNPKVIIAHTLKGKGVSFIEGHGKWHHRIPNEEELNRIFLELA